MPFHQILVLEPPLTLRTPVFRLRALTMRIGLVVCHKLFAPEFRWAFGALHFARGVACGAVISEITVHDEFLAAVGADKVFHFHFPVSGLRPEVDLGPELG